MNYDDWIKANVPSNCRGLCSEITGLMQESFPELKRVRGHYVCCVTGERSHWWLVDKGGVVVDPTKSQFPSNGTGVYVEWDESLPEPLGKCLNCGHLCYDSPEFCSELCGREYADFCKQSLCK